MADEEVDEAVVEEEEEALEEEVVVEETRLVDATNRLLINARELSFAHVKESRPPCRIGLRKWTYNSDYPSLYCSKSSKPLWWYGLKARKTMLVQSTYLLKLPPDLKWSKIGSWFDSVS